MKKILNFVKGAVSTKDLIPVLTNFHFYGGRVQGGNGRITIDAPLDLGGIDITVPAVPFLKAVEACDGTPNLNVTDKGRLTVNKGKFRSTLPLSDSKSFPLIKANNSGGDWRPEPGLIRALRTIRPFIGQDASRPWACGALFKGGYIYATNNVVMVRIPWDMPEGTLFNLPSFAVDELVRIGKEPDKFSSNDMHAHFRYGDSWMLSQLFETEWPDVSKFFTDEQLDEIPAGLLEAVEKVMPFCPDPKYPIITFNEQGVHTEKGDMGATVEAFNLPLSKYRAEPLLLVLEQATNIDMTKYPSPVPFAGLNGLQGVIIGLKP